MLKVPRLLPFHRFAAIAALTFLAGCSGSGCGNCTVPAYNAGVPTPLPPGVTPSPTPTPTPLPPGVTPSPTPTPTPLPPGVTPSPTPTPTPTPTPVPPAPLSCSQGGPATIPLGTALAPFALLAGSTITSASATTGATNVTYAAGAVTLGVNDDLIGVWPGSGGLRAVTGFYPFATDSDGVNAIYSTSGGFNSLVGPPMSAQGALTTAYNTAAGRPASATFTGGTDLATASVPGYPVGTLPAGVYNSPSSFSIASGNLTLDGGNNAQSVFIFQMGSTLTTTLNGGTSGNIILINRASACNIYWQVGSSATLGGMTFFGNVLANASITINAASFTGRALAETAAVSIPIITGSLITNPGGN